jgi:hypothetical protein
MRIRHFVLLVLAGTTLVSGQTPQTWPIRDAPAELKPTIARADLMIAAMHDSVLRELADGFAAGGAALAIKSCHIDSLLMAQRIAREGAAAGRTSDRLRNPLNAPKPWAAELVKANAGRQARHVEGFAVDLGDAVGVLRPISERPICANCHGPADRLAPAVRKELADRYPADKAVGFKEGEIRGWFWVEIPKKPRR